MTPKPPTPRTKHMAHKNRPDGGVSALCFSSPRAIDMRRATWTTTPDFVTCKKCRARIGKQPVPTFGISNLLSNAAPPPLATVTTINENAEPLTLLQRVETLERAFASVVLAAGNNAMRACGSERHPATAIFGDTPNG